MTSAEARRLIGKRITWKECQGRGWYSNRLGTIDGVIRKNVLIDGDWKWLPDLIGARAVEEREEV